MATAKKILVTSDWHLTENPRDRYRHDWQKRLRSIVRKKKVDLVIVLGDLCEEKDRHSAWLVNSVVDSLYRLTRLCPVIVLKGNHDYLNPTNPFWAFLERIEGLQWVSLPTEGKSLSAKPLEALGSVLFLPHTSDPDKEWVDLDFKDYDWVFTHNTFDGAVGESGRRLKGPSPSIFSPKNRVISGDVHVPQTLGRVLYVGAPYTVDFGDDYEPRVLLIDDGQIKQLRCDGPQKVLMEIAEGDGSIEKALNIESHAKELVDGDVVKVRVYITRKSFAKWPEIQKLVRQWGKDAGVNIHTIQPIVTGVEGKISKRRSVNRKDDTELLQEYVKRMGVDERTARVGEELLE